MRSIALGLVAGLLLLVPDTEAGGLLIPRDGSPPIGMSRHRVKAVVEDGLARTTVRQTFVNPHGRELEAIYVFPLPEGAALIDVAMETGGVRLEGLLAERKRARRVYDEIVRSRRDPALVEQIGKNTFRLSVYPVLPGEDTVIELSWIEHVPLVGGELHYVYPLAVGDDVVAVEQDFAMVAQLRSSVPFTEVSASTEAMEVEHILAGEVVAAMEVSNATLDADVVLSARVASRRAALSLRTHHAGEGDGWFQVVITPPEARPDQWIPRDVILVIDTSGSMKGEKIVQAKDSALWLLRNLRSIDRVNVLLFSSEHRSFAEAPVPPTPENLAELERFVVEIRARGGTALGDALVAAARVEPDPGRVRTVVLLTDGQPTIGERDPARLIARAKSAAGLGSRLFPFGVGQDVDGGLLRGLAAAGRGRAELFRPGGEIATRLTTFLARTAAPVLTDVTFSVDGVRTYGILPRTLPDLYLGEQLTITGRYRGAGEGKVRVSATAGGSSQSFARTAPFSAEPGGSPAVKFLHARAKLDYLEEARRLRLGLSDQAYYAALDRGAYSTADEIIEEMIDVSLEHGVQCAYTSFLVLLEEDRHRIDPRDAEALQGALERVRQSRRGGGGESAEEGEPVLQDAEISDHDQIDADRDFESSEGDPDFLSDSPFDDGALNNVIGIGGGAKYGGRFDGRRKLRAAGGSGTEQPMKDALEWLANHQDPDGKWSGDGFADRCSAGLSCDGVGRPGGDVCVTGLCVLAFLGDGHTTRQGLYKETVTRGIKWLREQQDFESGLFGDRSRRSYLRDHAIATVALCEAYYFSKNPLIRGTAQKAVAFLLLSREVDGVWRADASLTGWCVMALVSAEEAGLKVDARALRGVEGWLDELTEGEAGATETETACALLSRLFLGQDPAKRPKMMAYADRLVGALPVWSDDGSTNDPRYWCHGTYAMYQMGGEHWKVWNRSLKRAVLESQCREGCARGSWDPVGTRGATEGRVYVTALNTLSLEVYYRYAKVLGAR